MANDQIPFLDLVTPHKELEQELTNVFRSALHSAGVIVPNTFIATAEAISQAGARPYFVDVDERTYNMDPVTLRRFLEKDCSRNAHGELITKDFGLLVKAVIPVHLYGQMADM